VSPVRACELCELAGVEACRRPRGISSTQETGEETGMYLPYIQAASRESPERGRGGRHSRSASSLPLPPFVVCRIET
jgi:hypothetical protein